MSNTLSCLDNRAMSSEPRWPASDLALNDYTLGPDLLVSRLPDRLFIATPPRVSIQEKPHNI
jgi:hypothetical protein